MKTFFNKNSVPSNLLTISDFRKFAKALGLTSWESAIRHYANVKGGALLLKADGSLVSFTKRGIKISRKTFTPQQWGWEK